MAPRNSILPTYVECQSSITERFRLARHTAGTERVTNDQIGRGMGDSDVGLSAVSGESLISDMF